MELLKILIAKISLISKYAEKIEESWGYITMEGKYQATFIDDSLDIINYTKLSALGNLIQIRINEESLNEEELSDYKHVGEEFYSWKINLNKLPIIEVENDTCCNFFLLSENCKNWINEINLISNDCPINKYPLIKIIINDLKLPFGGEFIYFMPLDQDFSKLNYKNYWVPPLEDKIKESVHFITGEKIKLNLKNHYICEGDINNPIALALKRKSAIVNSICLVNEFYSPDKIVIDGIRRIPLKLVNDSDKLGLSFNDELCNVIEWIYEDRVSTRKKLFNERLSLEIIEGESLLYALNKNLDSALSQAQERYNFVIIDRKDAYVKELKDLLKDIKVQSELYSQKIRSLLSNFLRDVLAALLLVGFTLFTKFSDNINLNKSNLLEYVFYGLGIYYLFSVVMQSVIDWTDIGVSKKEMLYWKNSTKELIPEKEFKAHIDSSLKPRRYSLRILYPIIASLYILIAAVCFFYPYFFKNILLLK